MTNADYGTEDLQRLRQYVAEHGLTSCMNDTKWREAISALRGIPGFYVRFRARSVRDGLDEVPSTQSSFPWHVPSPHAHLEWLEVDPIVRTRRGALIADDTRDFTAAVIQSLKTAGVPISLEGGLIRIWGYLRPGSAPRFL
jgi:hypothetical protein